MTTHQLVLKHLPEERWKNEDNRELSESLDIPLYVVYYFRQKYKKPKAPRRSPPGRPSKVNLNHFDLRQTNAANAKKLGITPQHAGNLRRILEQNKRKEDFC